MKRLLLGIVVGLLVGATGAPASEFEKLVGWDQYIADREPGDKSHVRAAREAAGIMGSALAPPGRRASTHLYNCRRTSCRLRIDGTSRCDGTLQLRERAYSYDAWFSRLRCR